jgi:hypothetical protein
MCAQVLYQEVVITSDTFMRQLVAVDPSWIKPMLRKITELEPSKLMGRTLTSQELAPVRNISGTRHTNTLQHLLLKTCMAHIFATFTPHIAHRK